MTADAPPGRRERRKVEARARLMTAARQAIAERGVANLRIGDVTERADLGFGTFYSYFESKDALIEAVVSEAMTGVSRTIGTSALERPDPAESASESYRRFIRFACDEPELAGVLVELEHAHTIFENALLPWARETLERGRASGRFLIDDVELAVTSIAAAALAAIRAVLSGRVEPTAEHSGAEMMLRGFGLDAAAARELAYRDLG